MILLMRASGVEHAFLCKHSILILIRRVIRTFTIIWFKISSATHFNIFQLLSIWNFPQKFRQINLIPRLFGISKPWLNIQEQQYFVITHKELHYQPPNFPNIDNKIMKIYSTWGDAARFANTNFKCNNNVNLLVRNYTASPDKESDSVEHYANQANQLSGKCYRT